MYNGCNGFNKYSNELDVQMKLLTSWHGLTIHASIVQGAKRDMLSAHSDVRWY